jgi:exopolysaccharide biosynthesis polyprenyl glycosylphosphotransferase
MNKKIAILFIISNLIAATIFSSFYLNLNSNLIDFKLLQVFFVSGLMLLYLVFGTFQKPFRKSRFKELINTINQSIFIVIIYIFLAQLYFKEALLSISLSVIFRILVAHLFILYGTRLLFLTFVKRLLQNKIIGYKTLIIGDNNKAFQLAKEISEIKKSVGFNILGYIKTSEKIAKINQLSIPCLGSLNDLKIIIISQEIEEVIIAIETSQHHALKSILDSLEQTEVIINIIPDMYDIVSGFVKVNYLFSIPLITLHEDMMPLWQKLIKKVMDILISVLVLIILSPILLIISIIIKINSDGPIIYSQERIGLKGKPFNIYKFRTMFNHAETDKPLLSSANDQRITSVGLFLRKLRLDELPQFINVLKGDMSIVGPRPERQYFIDQIIKQAPHYYNLQKVLPGITSWGQVKYGYAENINQMIKRLTFDIIYIENRSLALDFKIMFYTIITILQGRGK